MRRIKLLVYGALTLLVFAIIAGGVVSLFIDLNGLKPTLAEAAREETGRDLSIDGDITLSLFPRPRATASRIRLSNVEGGSDPDVVTVDVASVQVSWLPLLTGTLDVRQIHAAGVRVLVEENATGMSSLAFEPAASASEPTGEPAPLPDIVDIRDIAVVVRDGGDQTYEIPSFTVRPVDGQDVVFSFVADRDGASIRGSGTVGNIQAIGGTDPLAVALAIDAGAARISVGGNVALGGDTQALDLTVKAEVPSLADLSPLAGAALPATAAFSFETGIAGTIDNVRMSDVAFRADGVDIVGSAAVDLSGDRTLVTAALNAAQLDLGAFVVDDAQPPASGGTGGDDGAAFLSEVPLPLEALRQFDSDISFSTPLLQVPGVSLTDAGFEVRGRGGVIEITRLGGALPEGTLAASGRLDARQEQASLDLDAEVSGLDIAKVLDALEIPAQSTRRAAARVTIASRGATTRAIADNLTADVSLSDLEVTVDGSARLILSDAAVRFEGRDRPVALSAIGSVRGETIEASGRLDPLAKYRPGEPYAFTATVRGAAATARLDADMQAAMVEGLAVRIAVEGAMLSELSRLTGGALPEIGPYSASGLLSFDEGAVSLTEASAQLGQSDLSGTMSLTFGDGLPGIVADLKSRMIDITSFQGSTPAGPVDETDAETSTFLTDTPLELGPLFGITADVQIAAEVVQGAGPELRDVGLHLVSDGETLRLEHFATQIDGQFAEATGVLRWTGTAAEVVLDAEIVGVEVDRFVEQAGLGERIDLGPLNVAVALESTGQSRAALFDNVVGQAEMRDFRFALQTDDRAVNDPITLDSLKVATNGVSAPLTVIASGTLGSEALDIEATLEPLARLRQMEPVPMDVSFATPTSHVRIAGTAPDRNRPSYVDFAVSAEGRIVREVAGLGGLSLNPEGPWRIGGQLTVDDGLVTLQDVQVAIGTSDIAGTFEFREDAGTTLVRAQATSSRLALTDFVPEEPAAAEEEGAATADKPVFNQTPFDFESLRAIDLDAGLQVKAFFGRSIAGDDLTVRLKAKDGLLTLERFAASVEGQPVLAKGAFDARGARANATASLVGGPFDLGALLLEFSPSAGSENIVQLPVDVDVELSTSGNSAHELAAGAGGRVDIIGGNGFIQQRAFRFLDQGLLRELTPWETERTRTNINCFVGRFDVAEGVASSQALLLDAEFISVSGRGSIDLGEEMLDLTLTPRPKEVRLLDLAVPVSVTGKINDPSFAPTTAGAAKKVATTLGVLVNPLVLLVPVIEGVTAEKNPCVAAIENAGKNESDGAGGAVGNVIRGIGEGVGGIGRGIGRIFGGGNKE